MATDASASTGAAPAEEKVETKRKRCQCADCTNYSVLGYDYCVCCMDEDTYGRECFCHCVGCVHAEAMIEGVPLLYREQGEFGERTRGEGKGSAKFQELLEEVNARDGRCGVADAI